MLVVDDLTFDCIHQKHFSRMETLFDDNLRRVDVQDAHLRGKNQGVVGGDVVTGRPKAVAVQNGSHHIAVAEQNGCRAVPGLHHGSVILVKITLFLRHGLVVIPGLRNGNHDGQRKIHTAHNQELQGIIQHGGVGTGCINHRKHLVQIFFQMAGLHGFLPGQHLVRVALDGVDLAVVYDKTVGMSSLPAGVCIGTETGMYDGDGRFVILILQILEEGTQLMYQEHALVYNGSAGKGYHVGIVVGLLKGPAGHIELSIEIQSLFHIRRTLHEALHDARHLLQRLGSENGRYGGNLSPAQELHALFFHNDLEHLPGLVALQLILGEEEHSDTVISFFT